MLFNTILGAKPLRQDGFAFYYSDYNNIFAMKGYYKDKWPCCSGTFPQITADYGISSYFHDANGIYVNLYVPSRATWTRGSARVTLTQRTNYPYQPTTQIDLTMAAPELLTMYLRIPAWSGPRTTVSVNGHRVDIPLLPGGFAAMNRTWRNGDQIEVQFDMSIRLVPVDPEHPHVVAPVLGPAALFAMGCPAVPLQRRALLSAV